MFKSRKKVTDVERPMVNQTMTPSASNQQKLELAKRLASRINIQKNLGPEAQDITQQAAAAILKGSAIAAPQVSVRLCVVTTTTTITCFRCPLVHFVSVPVSVVFSWARAV